MSEHRTARLVVLPSVLEIFETDFEFVVRVDSHVRATFDFNLRSTEHSATAENRPQDSICLVAGDRRLSKRAGAIQTSHIYCLKQSASGRESEKQQRFRL